MYTKKPAIFSLPPHTRWSPNVSYVPKCFSQPRPVKNKSWRHRLSNGLSFVQHDRSLGGVWHWGADTMPVPRWHGKSDVASTSTAALWFQHCVVWPRVLARPAMALNIPSTTLSPTNVTDANRRPRTSHAS